MEQMHSKISAETSEGGKQQRNRVDVLRRRLGLLAGKDHLVMKMYWERGLSCTEISKLAGVSESTVARRIRKLTKRLLDGEYIACVRSHDKLTQRELDIAREYFLLGVPFRKIADEQKCSYYQIRKTVKKIRRIIKTSTMAGKGKGVGL